MDNYYNIEVHQCNQSRVAERPVYANGNFVTVRYSNRGDSQDGFYSDDGINWTTVSMPFASYWDGVCYGNGRWIAWTQGDRYLPRGSYLAYSDDNGRSWTVGATLGQWSNGSPRFVGYMSYVNGRFLCFEPNGIISSQDGLTWEFEEFAEPRGSYQILYENGMYVGISSGGAVYSIDGTTWTEEPFSSSDEEDLFGFAYGNGTFVATPTVYEGIGMHRVRYSKNGFEWNEAFLECPWEKFIILDWDVCFDGRRFIAIASYRKEIAFCYSEDGATWSEPSVFSYTQSFVLYSGATFANGNIYVWSMSNTAIASPLNIQQQNHPFHLNSWQTGYAQGIAGQPLPLTGKKKTVLQAASSGTYTQRGVDYTESELRITFDGDPNADIVVGRMTYVSEKVPEMESFKRLTLTTHDGNAVYTKEQATLNQTEDGWTAYFEDSDYPYTVLVMVLQVPREGYPAGVYVFFSKDSNTYVSEVVFSEIVPVAYIDPTSQVLGWLAGRAMRARRGRGYVRKEYIQFDGAKYVDTGVICNQDTRIEAEFMRDNTTAYYLYGATSDDNKASVTAYLTSGSGNWRFGATSVSQTISKDTKYATVTDSSGVTRNGTLNKYNGTVGTFATPQTLTLGCNHPQDGTYGTSRFIGKVYAFRIYDGDKLVLDYVPAEKGGKDGFWDAVSNRFIPLEG